MFIQSLERGRSSELRYGRRRNGSTIIRSMKQRMVIAAVTLVRLPAARKCIIPVPGFTLRRYDEKKVLTAKWHGGSFDLVTAQPGGVRSPSAASQLSNDFARSVCDHPL